MRRTPLLALILALPSLGCASFQSYRDLTPDPPPALATAPSSPEADALVARFYGPGGADDRSIADALRRAPGSSALHEIAGYEALSRADPRAAFDHFLAAAADQGAVSPELYLWEMESSARTVTDHLRAQALLREMKDGHPRASVRQLAAYDLAREIRAMAEYPEAEALISGLGFLPSWQVAGAFDNDQGKGLLTAYSPEEDPDPGKTFPGMRVPVRFRPVSAGKLDGALPLGDVVWPAESAVAYALTFVTAARGRQVDLRLTTTNAVRVWLNGRLVGTDDKIFHEELDNVVLRVTLRAGENRLLVKSAHQRGPFRLAARFTEIDGSIPADLRDAATGSPPSATPAATAGGQMVSPMGAIDRVADKNRRRFLQARLWAREGHARRSAWYLSPLLADAPDNPVVAYFAAGALLENAEAGKALDLWSRTAARHPETWGILVDRARFYADRRLWDRAEEDLAAVVAHVPAARDARMEQAAILARRGWTIDRCLALAEVVDRWPDDAGAIEALGRCRLDRAYAEDAEQLFRRAHALVPGDPGVLDRLVEVAERRLDHGAAEARLHDLQAARPGAPDLLLAEGELLRRQGRTDDARRAIEAAKDRDPDAPRAYDRLAQIALENKDRAGAERWWRLALDRDPEDANLSQHLAALAPTALPLGDRLAPTADDIDRAVQSARHVRVHPGSHRVWLLDDEVTTVHPDGSSKRIVTQVQEAVTTDGRDAMIRARLPARGRVNVIAAYAVQRSGERQEASSITGGVVRFRQLEVGSITVVQYAHFAPPPRFLPNEYVTAFRFQDVNAQVESSRLRLVLPRDRALHVETRGQVDRSVEDSGDLRVWSFSARSVPPLVPEPNMPPAADEIWSVAVSTLPSWDAYARWESALLADAFQPSAEIDALARRITAGARTPREKIDRLTAHVAQEIRYQQDYEDTIAGVRPHAAGMVVERGYGDCKDKAVLLIRLARAVGVEMRFAVLRTTNVGKVWKDIPNQQFNHAIAYVPRQAGIDAPFFVDTTTNGLDVGNLRSDDQGATSLVLGPEGRWEMIPIPYESPDLDYGRHDLTVDLRDPDKARGHDHFEARGSVANGIRIALRSAEGKRRFYQRLSDAIFTGTTLISGRSDHDQDLTRPLSIQLDVDLKNAVKPEDAHLRFDVPLPFPLSHATALTTRRHPLRLWRGTEALSMNVDLPEGAKVIHLPPDLTVKHACFTLSRRVEAKKDHVVVSTRYEGSCPEVAPADYPGFRAAVQKVVAASQESIVFAPRKGAAAMKAAAPRAKKK